MWFCAGDHQFSVDAGLRDRHRLPGRIGIPEPCHLLRHWHSLVPEGELPHFTVVVSQCLPEQIVGRARGAGDPPAECPITQDRLPETRGLGGRPFPVGKHRSRGTRPHDPLLRDEEPILGPPRTLAGHDRKRNPKFGGERAEERGLRSGGIPAVCLPASVAVAPPVVAGRHLGLPLFPGLLTPALVLHPGPSARHPL